MNKDRLMRLVKLLRADAANPKGVRFNLLVWTHTPNTRTEPSVSCNTQACAIGLACISGEFSADGLHYSLVSDGRGYNISPEYDRDDGWNAVDNFFGLSRAQSVGLFSAHSYRYVEHSGTNAELAVADRIEKLVNGADISSLIWLGCA